MALLTPFPLADVQRIASAYGLTATGIEPLSLGSVNSNFRVTVDGGSRQVFGRLYEEQDEAGAAAELRAVTELAALGIPTPPPFARSDGGWVSMYRDKPVSFYPWVDGKSPCQGRVTARLTKQLGQQLARLHGASAGLTAIPEGRFGVGAVLRRLDWIEAKSDSFTEPSQHIRRKQLEYAARRIEKLPEGLIHGDLFRDNVLVSAEQIVALIDFESAALGPFVHDLMVCVHAWCFTDKFEQDLVEGLLSGYLSERSLGRDEVRALPVEGALAALRFATTRITDFSMRAAPGEQPARDYRRFLTRLELIEAGALDPVLEKLGLVESSS